MEKTLKMIINEFKSNVAEDMVDGIAVLDVRFTRLTKGTGLLLFHGGGLLLLEVMSKNKIRSSWQESVKSIDLLKLKNAGDCAEFVKFVKKRHASILARP